MGRSRWFFSLSGVILLVGALAIGGKGLNFGLDFKSGTRIETALVKPKVTEAQVAGEMTKLGFPNAEVQKYSNSSVGANGYQISTKTLRPSKVNEDRSGAGAVQPAERLRKHQRSGRPSGKQDRQERGDQGDHRLAAGDLRLRGAALRPEVRGAGADRADARPADHGRRLLADGEGSHDGDGRRSADDPRILLVRHDHRVRPNTREHAADAASCVLADRQPLDERGLDAFAGDQLHDAACGLLAAGLRRRDAAGLRLRDAGRDRLRYLLVDLHRLAGADRLEGTRARLHRARRARLDRRGRGWPRARLRRPPRAAKLDDVEPEEKKRRRRRA